MTTHVVVTPHDRRLARNYLIFRNEVFSPTRPLQRGLTIACIVALGFMFEAGLLRYICWLTGAVILIWSLISSPIIVQSWLRSEPFRNSKEANKYLFTDKGFRQSLNQETKPEWLEYAQIIACYVDQSYWFLRLKSNNVVVLARNGVDEGKTEPEQFERFLTMKTGLVIIPVKLPLRDKIRRVQEARRGYLDTHPSWLTKAKNKSTNCANDTSDT